jgi:hypothetical protein
LLRFIQGLQRSGVRGRQSLTALLARRLRVLQAAPVQIASYPPLFVDLRNRNHHSFFANSPYRHLPRNRPVQTVMQHVVRLHIPRDDSMACLAAGYATRNSATAIGTPCVLHRLDDLLAAGEVPQPGFMKIDTEGAELLLFQAARATLDREDAPILIYESNLFAAPMVSGAAAPAATCFLAQLARPRYRFFFIWSWGALTPLLPGQSVHDNILAVPEARLDRWPKLATGNVLEI